MRAGMCVHVFILSRIAGVRHPVCSALGLRVTAATQGREATTRIIRPHKGQHDTEEKKTKHVTRHVEHVTRRLMSVPVRGSDAVRFPVQRTL